ncbi:MAG: hypothetical protein QW597_01730 [Thermoplasmataceae archaeon]
MPTKLHTLGKMNYYSNLQLHKELYSQDSMRKKLVEIGVVMLIAGVAILAIGGITISETTIISSHYSEPSRGEYISYEINVSGSGSIIVFGNGTIGSLGLVAADDIHLVNASNIATIAITPSVALGGLQIYNVNHSSYFFVIFTDSSPEYVYTYFPGAMFDELAGIMAGGFAIFLTGLTVTIVGVFLRNDRHRSL